MRGSVEPDEFIGRRINRTATGFYISPPPYRGVESPSHAMRRTVARLLFAERRKSIAQSRNLEVGGSTKIPMRCQRKF